MVIAVTVDGNDVHPHLGLATDVRFYTVEDGKVVSAETEHMAAAGHSFIARVLFKHFTNVVICGGIRTSAKGGLEVSGMEVTAGASGPADDAVEAYLRGELKNDPDACRLEEECAHDPD